MKRTTIVSSLIAGLVIAGSILLAVQPDLAIRARAALAQHKGSIHLRPKYRAALNPRQMQIGLHFRTNSPGNIH